MKTFITILQILISLFLVASILLQVRGTGLGSAWGGGGESYRSRRGMEKILFAATILLAAGFLLLSLANSLIL